MAGVFLADAVTSPSLILTKPQAQNAAWAQVLAALGVPCVALPLLETGLRKDAAFLTQRGALLQSLSRWRAIMHVSPNAVAALWDGQTLAQWRRAQASGDTCPRLWAPGPGTAQALLACGFLPQEIDQPAAHAQQFDSEALWEVVAPQCAPAPGTLAQRGTQVLIVRGMIGRMQGDVAGPAAGKRPAGQAGEGESDRTDQVAQAADTADTAGGRNSPRGSGRDWLAQRLQQQGVEVVFLPAYWRDAPVWDDAQRDLARQAAVQGRVWLLSSSEGVRYLPRLLPDVHWQSHRAIATHERIASAARTLGFGQVALAQPTPQAVALALKGR